jgi:hypothetical protein
MPVFSIRTIIYYLVIESLNVANAGCMTFSSNHAGTRNGLKDALCSPKLAAMR